MTQIDEFSTLEDLSLDLSNDTSQSLAQIWAKKYVKSLQVEEASPSNQDSDFNSVMSRTGREQTADKLNQALRFTSAQAWSKTEGLLALEVQRHHINPDLIDPWQIAVDSRYLFEKALSIYTEQSPPYQFSVWLSQNETAIESMTDLPSPGRLSVAIAQDVGKIRQKYTTTDPRVLGFVSMQFHYTGQLLLDLLSPWEKILVSSYFKVIDDHLYMPLQRSYDAAAKCAFNAPNLTAVQQLLPISSDIAKDICHQVAQMYPTYRSHSGLLGDHQVKTSSIRDVEMFQVYLCLCVLEGNITALQQELFPLCVMLYPPLNVSWGVVRHMLRFLGQRISDRLGEEHIVAFRPYIKALWEMFSQEVLPDN